MSPFQKGTSGNPNGAKPRRAGEKRARISATIAPATDQWLRETARDRGEGIGDVIDLVVKHERARSGKSGP